MAFAIGNGNAPFPQQPPTAAPNPSGNYEAGPDAYASSGQTYLASASYNPFDSGQQGTGYPTYVQQPSVGTGVDNVQQGTGAGYSTYGVQQPNMGRGAGYNQSEMQQPNMGAGVAGTMPAFGSFGQPSDMEQNRVPTVEDNRDTKGDEPPGLPTDTDIGPLESYRICHVSGFSLPFVGYLICFLILLEGIFVMYQIIGLLHPMDVPWITAADQNDHNPFSPGLLVFLWILCLGDIAVAFIGPLGLFLCNHYMPYVWKMWYGLHASVATGCFGSVLVWRLAVLIIASPWVGVYLAFMPPEYKKGLFMFWAMFLIVLNVFSLWALLLVYDMVASKAKILQRRIDVYLDIEIPSCWDLTMACCCYIDIDITEFFLDLPLPGLPDLPDLSDLLADLAWLRVHMPAMFCCLPLEASIIWYVIIIMICAILWLLLLLERGYSGGGWASAAPGTLVPQTWTLEFCLYAFTIFESVIALGGMSHRRTGQGIEDTLPEKYKGDPHAIFSSEEMLFVLKAKKRCAACFFTYLLFSILRLALFFPITGMLLVERDVCGLYVHGISQFWSFVWIRRPYCSEQDIVLLSITVLFFVLDTSMIYQVYRLWHWYQESANRARVFWSKRGKWESYGAAGDRPVKAVTL